MASLEEQLKKAEENVVKAKDAGSSSLESLEAEVALLKWKIKKEEGTPKPHPALQFGPISQTVAVMSAISLGMSISPLPYQAVPFYYLFSRITICAVLVLVGYTAVIWYGYEQAVAKLPKPDPEAKLRALLKSKPPRPDEWAHTRSHPSHFLTTRHAPPRLFPFPLGKSRPAATVKDELWWEGGNAPHVGHFNKPTINRPPNPDMDLLTRKAELSIEMEKNRIMWKKRINGIKSLSVIVIVAFVNQKIAIAALCYLIYTTIQNEIYNMLQPPTTMDEIESTIASTQRSAALQAAPRQDAKAGVSGGMAYLYDPTESGGAVHNSNIPILGVIPAPVLMTSENHYYAEPGEPIRRME